MTFRRFNIDFCSYAKRFPLLLYQLNDLLLPNYNSHSIQHVTVSQPDINELSAAKFPLRSVNEFHTNKYTTAGPTTECNVRCCSSVIIQHQYIYCTLVKGKVR